MPQVAVGHGRSLQVIASHNKFQQAPAAGLSRLLQVTEVRGRSLQTEITSSHQSLQHRKQQVVAGTKSRLTAVSHAGHGR